MHRRAVLGSVAGVFVAGCTGPAAGNEPQGDGTTKTTGGAPAYEGTAFEVVAADCGGTVEDATISFDADASTVTVEGTTSGPDACYTARVAADVYDAEADRFELVVEAHRAQDEGGCAQCITEIDYAATASFTGGLPGTVVVVHRSRGDEREVASAEP